MAARAAERGLLPWRFLAGAVLAVFLAGPLVFPLTETLLRLDQAGGLNGYRLARVGAVTLALIGGVLMLALPAGTFLAFLFFRTPLPCRRFLLSLVVVALFVPLPVTTSAWQGLLGEDGWLPQPWWGANAVRLPWAEGLLPAIWIHAWAGLPWTILIVGFGLRGIERELEEEALMDRSPVGVVWSVTLPRCRWALVSAGFFLVVQTAGEICVVYMTQVPTFAEEVHLQFSLGDVNALARSVAAAGIWAALLAAILLFALPRLLRAVPDLSHADRPPLLFPLGKGKPLALLACSVAVGSLVVLPLASLVRRLGLPGGETWSSSFALGHLGDHFVLYGWPVFRMLLVAVATGLLVACAALVTCWLLRGSRWFSLVVLVPALIAVALPGPVLGIGLMDAVRWILGHGLESLRPVLYDDGPAPLLWVHFQRFFPLALVMSWPVVSRVPQEWLDGLRLEGTGLLGEFRQAIWPFSRGICGFCVLGVTALSLGEVAAACRVDTPGWETFSKVLFDRMHYGVDSNVAAVALVLLLETLPLAAGVGWFCARGIDENSAAKGREP